MTIYCGNLPYKATEIEVQSLFEKYGEVESVKLIVDRDTGRKKGYGFVTMNDEDAQKAIEELNDTEFGGRNIKVNMAKEREDRPPRGNRSF